MKNTECLMLRMTARHRRLLKLLAEREGRSLNSMIRVLIERAARQAEAAGTAKGTGHATGRSN